MDGYCDAYEHTLRRRNALRSSVKSVHKISLCDKECTSLTHKHAFRSRNPITHFISSYYKKCNKYTHDNSYHKLVSYKYRNTYTIIHDNIHKDRTNFTYTDCDNKGNTLSYKFWTWHDNYAPNPHGDNKCNKNTDTNWNKNPYKNRDFYKYDYSNTNKFHISIWDNYTNTYKDYNNNCYN
jgi:hypothetical protein